MCGVPRVRGFSKTERFFDFKKNQRKQFQKMIRLLFFFGVLVEIIAGIILLVEMDSCNRQAVIFMMIISLIMIPTGFLFYKYGKDPTYNYVQADEVGRSWCTNDYYLYNENMKTHTRLSFIGFYGIVFLLLCIIIMGSCSELDDSYNGNTTEPLKDTVLNF